MFSLFSASSAPKSSWEKKTDWASTSQRAEYFAKFRDSQPSCPAPSSVRPG